MHQTPSQRNEVFWELIVTRKVNKIDTWTAFKELILVENQIWKKKKIKIVQGLRIYVQAQKNLNRLGSKLFN